ncbi:ornithine cyclodeaminase family protein [Salinigranum halophilum]|uniref:ornithine cyclodeaminase family protein n=1 Tax=Salinigranum halophilum TaxID=2565931 RepID=UPI0010A82A92|nr:ornithine cyclodeaminase family protein [Salinigranum halophilum]
MTEAIYLTSEDVAELADQPDVEDYINVVQDGYRQRGEGAPAKPRTTLHPNEGPWGMLTSYMAILPETGAMGGYMYDVGFAAEDGWLTTSLWAADSGEFLAHLDGNAWNPRKTGATGAVGIDALARPDVDTLGIIGSGSQARGQIVAAAAVRDFDTVRVFSPTEESREAFAAEMQERLDADVDAVGSSKEAVSGADVVITATTSKEPVFDGSNLDPGTHVTAMGQYDPDGRELDTETIERATYVPDLRERAFQDAGSFLYALDQDVVSEDHIYAELGDVVAGSAPGRTSTDEVTVFDSGGTGIETVAAAKMLYDMGVEQGMGTQISIASSSEAQSD